MITSDAGDFARATGGAGRLLGMDVGTRTIGLALCDAGWSFATPDRTLARGRFAADLDVLGTIIARERITGLVVGLPLSMDGSDSPRTQGVRAFARNCAPLDRPLLLWDERWSTLAVERQMIAADVSRAKRAERIDAAAAAYIVQGAIDALVRHA